MSEIDSAQRMDSLAAEVQVLKDKLEVRETLNRYWFGEDRCDPDIVASAFSEDGQFGPVKGRAAVARLMRPGLASYVSILHCIASSRVDIDGDTAEADTMAVAFDVARTADGEEVCLVRGLRYVDDLRRTADGWRIARRSGHANREYAHDTLWQFEGRVTPLWHPQGVEERVNDRLITDPSSTRETDAV